MRTAFSIGGAIMMAIVTAIGFALDALNVKSDISWQWLALIGFVAFIIIVWQGWAASEHRAKRYENAKPNLVWQNSKEWQFYLEGQPSYRATQIWLVNKPQIATDNSIAKNVSASIWFFNEKGKRLFEMFGVFTEAVVPDHATIQAFKELKEQVDIWPPNNIPRKLLVAYRYVGDESAYGFARSNFLNTGDGREQSKELPKGNYYLEVGLAGIGIDQPPYWFALVIPDKEGRMLLSRPLEKPPIKKPRIHIEDLSKV